MKPKLGDKVTTLRAVEAYYSNYGGLPYCAFAPGDVGIVAAVDVPVVRGRDGATFTCVDFYKYGRKWRVALKNDQLVRVKP